LFRLIKIRSSSRDSLVEKIRWPVLCSLCFTGIIACSGDDGSVRVTGPAVATQTASENTAPDITPDTSEATNDAASGGSSSTQVAEPNEPENNSPQQQPEPVVPAVAFTATVEDITDLVLVTGQSNALGAGTSYDEFLDAPNNRVMAYTSNGWQIANLNQIWDRNWFPRTNPDTPPSNNFAFHFAKRIANKAPGRVVGFILLTAPGEPISHWNRDSEFFKETRNKVSRAINELPYKSSLDAILWHQGESDGEDRDQYSQALYDLIERFRSEPWFGFNRPFICGETAESPVNRQLGRLNSDGNQWTACIKAEGLDVLPNTVHFSAASLRTMGLRYADVYLERMLGIR